MSDNEDLLGDDLGDQSLADYNLGNEEEEQLLADDYDNNASQNVPTSAAVNYRERIDMVPTEYPSHNIEYVPQQTPYPAATDSECVVPNITVEVPNVTLPEHSTYAPYPEAPVFETELAVVPPAIPAAPVESPQIVPSEVTAPVPNGDLGGPRERFTTERPPGVQRMPQVRDIPDSLDKVYVPRSGFVGRGRNSWRNPHYRTSHPYRRNNAQRENLGQRGIYLTVDFQNNFPSRSSFPPQQMRTGHQPPPSRLNHMDMRPDTIHPPLGLEPSPERSLRPPERSLLPPDRSLLPADRSLLPPDRSLLPPDRSLLPPDRSLLRPERSLPPLDMPNSYRPLESRPYQDNYPRYPEFRPSFEPRPPFQYQPTFNPRPFGPTREIAPSSVSHIPQVTIRQQLPVVASGLPKMDKFPKLMGREPEVRMLPVQLPPNLPPGGLAGKKVLINPHFKGNFQPPVEGLPTYIPTRIQKTPPLSPTLESKFGPIKDIDDAAERFIAEQRNALARAATRKAVRRSPQRYIENTTIEIENELARRTEDEELLRRQEEFINANRAGLRRRMRSASPVAARRSPEPRRSPPRRARHDPPDEDSEYRRRVREQESLRERVLRAKEMRRRRNAVATNQHGEREKVEKEKEPAAAKVETPKAAEAASDNRPSSTQPDKPDRPDRLDRPEKGDKLDRPEKPDKPDTTRKSPDKLETDKAEIRDRSPVKIAKDEAEVNSTCENLTPPREKMPQKEKEREREREKERERSPERALTPPLPSQGPKAYSDDELDLILDDIDDILSDEDSGRFKEKKEEASKAKSSSDLRAKLPARRPPRQKIVFGEPEPAKEKSPIRRTIVTSSTKADNGNSNKKSTKAKQKTDAVSAKSRARIIFDKKEPEGDKGKGKQQQQFANANRRVVLQRAGGVFGRAVRTALGEARAPPPPRPAPAPAPAPAASPPPRVEYGSESEGEPEGAGGGGGAAALVTNLPHGITDTRLRTLAGDSVQSLILDKEERSAKISFKTAVAADNFRRKFNNKMVAASRLTVTLR